MNEEDVTRQISESLNKAVRKELQKKAKLGQDAVIDRKGKPVRVKASELIKDNE
ncbi:MAG: hypothetical protein KAR42_17790 [candidate division Zixibacteria bacterium]|nr:hypothetical protein [candidate division Zixibacteria bacterium]